MCETGQYSLKIGAAVVPCLPFEPCPKGADCRFSDGLRAVNLLAQNSYWRPNATSRAFVDCTQAYVGKHKRQRAAERCCPLRNESTAVSSNGVETVCNVTLSADASPNSQCAIGYEGMMCNACSSGRVKRKNSCVPCQQRGHMGFAMLGICGFGFLVFLMLCAWVF